MEVNGEPKIVWLPTFFKIKISSLMLLFKNKDIYTWKRYPLAFSFISFAILSAGVETMKIWDLKLFEKYL